MKLSEFLLSIQQEKKLPSSHLICFSGKDNYPLLFFSLLLNWLKKQQSSAVVSTAVHDQKELFMQAQLETSFLGTSLFYWIGNLMQCNRKIQIEWIDYLQKYQGPHKIAFFITQEVPLSFSDNTIVVTLPSAVSYEDMLLLQRLFSSFSMLNRQFVRQLSKIKQKISLDSFCLLLNYCLLIGKNSDEFFTAWLDYLLPIQPSLFELSQYFFAKNGKQFFITWSHICNNYNSQFWVVFWSEQIWRAMLWIDLYRNKRFDEAKRMQFKLPFSFLKHDWKKYCFSELQSAHQFITVIDHHLKNNGSSQGLDLFYSKFFLNQFA